MTIIAALTKDRVIGRDNAIPWHISGDLKLFKRVTMGHTLVMGRKTFESIGGRPLPGRKNIVVSRTLPETGGIDVCRTFEGALDLAESFGGETFIAGGAALYRQALPLADVLMLSHIKRNYAGDIHFPEFDGGEWDVESEEDHPEFVFVIYKRKKR